MVPVRRFTKVMNRWPSGKSRIEYEGSVLAVCLLRKVENGIGGGLGMGANLTKWIAVIGIVAACSWIPAYAQAPQEQGLVAHYTFDEGQGDVAKDHSGNNNDGKINGATWEKLGEGYALKFGYKKSFVDLGTEHNIPVTGDMTLTVWVKLMAAPDKPTNYCIVDCETYKKSGFLVRVNADSSQIFYRASQEGGLASTNCKYNNWALKNFIFHHVAITRTGTSVTFYLDGTLDGVFKIKQPLPPTRGLNISSRGQSFNGLLDELKFYNRVLSAEEIQAEYQKGAKGHANQ